MRGVVVIIALLASCATEAPKPVEEPVPYRYEFRTHVEITDSEPFDARGVGVVFCGVTSTEVKATGQIHRVIVATEKKAMILHPNMEAWVDSGPESQSVGVLLKVIEDELAGAKADGDVLKLDFEGEAAERVAERLGIRYDGVPWRASKLSALVTVAEGRVRRVQLESKILIALKATEATWIKTTADVTIVEYGGAKLLRPEGIPMDDALRELGLDPGDFK